MRSWSKWSSPFWGSILVVALSLPARAQSADAGASGTLEPAAPEPAAPLEPTEPASDEGPAEPGAAPGSGGAAGAEPAPPPGLKALSPSQRLPENLQGWMRERHRRNPALVERHPVTATQPALAPRLSTDDPAVAAVQRRLRSFSEGGVTVLSNRREVVAPVAPQVTRVAAASAVARPAPAPQPAADALAAADAEESVVEEPSVETRSLRAQPSAPRRGAEEGTPQWPAWLAVSAALGLFVVWLRKRRSAV